MGKGKIWQQLERIFIAIPSIQKFVDSTDKPEKTMDAWISMLEGCDSDDLEHVVSKVVGGELELIGQWDKPDVVPRVLRREANDIRSRRNAKAEQQEKYHNNSRGLMNEVRKTNFGQWAISVGELVREKKISREQNNILFDELLAWDRGGDLPLWISDGKFSASKAVEYATNY
jgi:hypothetical protein